MIAVVRAGVRLPAGGELPVVVYEVRGRPAVERTTIETDRAVEGKPWIVMRNGAPDPEPHNSAEEALEKLEAEI